MKPQLSERVKKRDFPGEFLEVILSAASDPSTISFAGGLPNPTTLPVEEVSEASKKVFEKFGYVALQYSQAQGFLPLRQKIADRYKKTMGICSDVAGTASRTTTRRRSRRLSAEFSSRSLRAVTI